jgi:drug/metabolite transporter (DMT)-like permease
LSLAVFLMVVASASLHVFWNTLVKRCEDKVSFAWLTTVAGTVAVAPVFVGARLLAPGALDGRIVGLAVLSGLVEAGYIIALFTAYDHTDLSVAYPLSRGIAPVVGLVPGIVLLGDTLTLAQSAGVALIVAGVAGVGGSAVLRSRDRRAARRGLVLAAITGCLIAGYHLVDRRALTRSPAPSMVEYYFLMHATLLAALTAWVWAWPPHRHRLWNEWRGNRVGVVAVGVLSVAAYMLIMAALRWGNVTLVAATRNIGIVISTVVGAWLLKERVCVLRGAGAGLIVAGVLTLLLSGR